MKTLEQLKAEQEKAMRELTREHEIARAMPFPPVRVTSVTARAPWVSYEVETLREACEMFAQFRVIPANVWRGTFTTVAPDCARSEKDRERAPEPASGPYACAIRVSHGDNYGTTSELQFYAETGAGPVNVHIRFGKGYARGHALAPCVTETCHARTGRIESRHFSPSLEARAIADNFISWGTGESGPVKTSADHTFLLSADLDETGATHSHAVGMLEILADRAKV